ncbi:MAG: translation initiation factor Sui1 [Proteobacteria bacterium]|nr:translation initiation factor Sui1 [Pseudomonadota bacterium]MBU1709622.1 translation initiation factor Sui1 [Pseudomonadota bacterium]
MKNSVLVYSTDRGRICSGCGHPAGQCCCSKKSLPAGDGIVRISRETKGRKGSGVSLISGLSLDKDGLKELAGQLKRKCGSGGSIKNGVIEIQGDHRDVLMEMLVKQGFKVKLAGG